MSEKDVLVLGAGMVGVSTALALQARGFAVTLADRRAPGQETSFGNAGIIQAEAVEPYALPRDVFKLVRFALQRDNAVHYHLRALPGQAGPLLRYFLNSSPSRHAAVSAHYSGLIRQATAQHAPWITASGAEALIRRTGYRTIFRSAKALDAEMRNAERLGQAYGVQSAILDGAALAAAEPGFTTPLAGAIHWTQSWSCIDPGGLVAAYARLFSQRGGRLVVADVTGLRETAQGWHLATSDGGVEAAHVVVALGPWSAAFLRGLSYRVPMVLKRGYHRHYATGRALTMPHYDTERSYLLCPMAAGLRLTSGAEVAALGADLTPVQLRRAEASARELVALGPALSQEPWAGTRPCMPDMLPVIGKFPRHKNLWGNFGHGHQGFTLGPVTGQLLAEQMAQEQNGPNPFAPTRLAGL